jgi:glutathione S-transferase
LKLIDKMAKRMKQESNLTLYYGNIPGAMELSRIVLAVAGRFPDQTGGYTDKRLVWGGKEMTDFQASGKFKFNMGRIPMAEEDGVMFGQSNAIHRYNARSNGLFGKTELEGAVIDSIHEGVNEMVNAWRKLVPYGNKMSEDERKAADDTWFNTDPTPKPDRSNRQLDWFLSQLEAMVGEGEWAVGDAVSLADCALHQKLGDYTPFEDAAATQKALEKCPKLNKVLANVAALENVKKWQAYNAQLYKK